MKININKKIPFIQIVLLIFFFSGNSFTLLKLSLMTITVLICGRNFLKKHIDLNFILLFIFFVIYYLFSQHDGRYKSEFNIQLLLAPPILYLTGKWFGQKAISSMTVVRVFWLIGLALATMTLKAVFTDIIQNGFSDGARNLVVSDNGDELSATVLGGLLVILVSYSGLAFSISPLFNKIERFLILLFFLLSIFAAARLGSRTVIAIGIISLIQGIFLNRKHYRLFRLSLVFSIFLASIFYFIDFISGFIDVFSYYQDRLDSDDYGTTSAGGRTEKWLNSIVLMIENPMGWGIDVNGHSHNLWLDVARNGGLISFTMSIIVTSCIVKSFLKSLSRNSNDNYFVTAISCIGTAFLMLFLLEPIFDGFAYVFFSFCCFWGIVHTFKQHTNISESRVASVDSRYDFQQKERRPHA